MEDVNRDVGSLLRDAHEQHKAGFNCSETVFWALSKYWCLDLPVSAATGFGGGISRSGATCGAVTGAIMALGCKVGRTDPKDDSGKALAYKLGREVLDGFRKEFGTANCKDIIGFVLGDEGGAERYAAGDFKDAKCKDAIETAITSTIRVWGEINS